MKNKFLALLISSAFMFAACGDAGNLESATSPKVLEESSDSLESSSSQIPYRVVF